MPVSNGVYRRRNYDRQFHGLVTARTALGSALNVPAVKTLGLVGVEAALDLLGGLGFRNLRAADFYGPSLALGSVDCTLWDLVNAYRTLAQGGLWSPLRLAFDPVAGGRRALSSEATFLVSDILSDRESRSRTFALESPLSTRFWSAVKTGTSKDMRDNWCVGSSRSYTAGVWVGNFSGTIVALDPDIPAGRQKLFFEAEPRDSRLRWTLDGERLESSGGLVLWTPRAGRHTLRLADPAGRIVDTVEFEVRGSVALP